MEDEQSYSYPTSVNDESQPSTSNEEKKSLAITPCSSGTMNSEPIYAVVDLKNKYARRKLKELENGNIVDPKSERPRSLHVGSSDYEEVKILCNV